jgi:Skp family chaperone for outer membrane proteins
MSLKITCLVLLAVFVSMTLAARHAIAGEKTGDIADDIASEQVELEKAKSEMAVLDLEIAAREQNLDQNRQQLADARMMLDDAERRYNDSLRSYEERLTAIYKLGEGQFYAVLLSSEGINDAASRLSYMVTISENDKKMVSQVKADAEAVRRLHKKVDTLKQESAEGLDDLRAQRAEMSGDIDTRQQKIDEENSRLAEAQAREMATTAAQNFNGDLGSLFDSLTAPALISGNDEPPEGLEASGMILSGVASWYGPGFHGENTSSGEVYDMFAYTAAHKSLPFNTWLKVTYNGRSVFVRINDRGPYIGDRFLDVSASAARAIGLSGIGFVTAEVYR